MAGAAEEPAGRRQVSTLILLCCAGVLATGLPLPFGLAAVAFLVPALVVAIRVLATKGRRPRVFAVLAIVLIVLLTGTALVRAVFYPAQLEYQKCMTAAITEEGRQACDVKLRRSLLKVMA